MFTVTQDAQFEIKKHFLSNKSALSKENSDCLERN